MALEKLRELTAYKKPSMGKRIRKQRSISNSEKRPAGMHRGMRARSVDINEYSEEDDPADMHTPTGPIFNGSGAGITRLSGTKMSRGMFASAETAASPGLYFGALSVSVFLR